MSGNGIVGFRQYGDAFSDVDADLGGFGSLSGAAMNRHERAEARVKQEGVNIHGVCDNCGAHNIVIAEWPEVIFIAEGRIPPQGWRLDQGHVRAAVGCKSCNRELAVGVVPEEAGKWVRAATSARFLTPQQVATVVQQARAGR